MSGIELIAKERERQISGEGWTTEHDDQHRSGELAGAAACYVIEAIPEGELNSDIGEVQSELWPWEVEWWKPGTPIRNLVKAGALIAAEIDRRIRAGESI